jgi:hypothetical protein
MQEQIRLGHTSGLDSTNAAFHARFPNSVALGSADWYAAWGKNNVRGADSIALANYNHGKTLAQTAGSAGALASSAELEGRPSEALKWSVTGDEATYKAEKTKWNEFAIGLDTAYYLAAMLEKPADARTAYARAVARVPLSQMKPEERNWRMIARFASRMRDPALAKQALDGFEHDQASREPDPEGSRAFFQAHVALAEGKWDAAIDALHTADKRFSMFDKYALAALAMANDFGGHADSAIVYYERFAAYKDPNMSEDSQFLPGSYKRLGELYEAKGNTAKAVENYEKFTELWKNAEPEMQPKVKEVRDKIARLTPVEKVKK